MAYRDQDNFSGPYGGDVAFRHQPRREDPWSPASAAGGATSSSPGPADEPAEEESSTTLGLVGGLISYMFSDNRCCSMRTKPPDPPKAGGGASLPERPRPADTRETLHDPFRTQPFEEDPRGVAPPGSWRWPEWSLNFKKPCIEVFVIDEDSGEKRWVTAEPHSRVVDKDNHDAYLCAEYAWDGEMYVQDFGPEHVRRRGENRTVMDEIAGRP
ncbi:unnamed protein product [Prorocentrum cordatum]|uniref:Uncharacterized protein n=1 Tax=Prorocentrum cordatum TaxID=2364126 RepID=A0ABN9Y7Z0_9DINO|nr:unnamed protein product [Polarella glacialis]